MISSTIPCIVLTILSTLRCIIQIGLNKKKKQIEFPDILFNFNFNDEYHKHKKGLTGLPPVKFSHFT